MFKRGDYVKAAVFENHQGQGSILEVGCDAYAPSL
jgi:hypothetical protein